MLGLTREKILVKTSTPNGNEKISNLSSLNDLYVFLPELRPPPDPVDISDGIDFEGALASLEDTF
jgi:hypothetical protein